jgi:fatty-acyl-CoA synthase
MLNLEKTHTRAEDSMNNGHSSDTTGSLSDVSRNPLTPLDFLKRSELVFPGKKAVVYRDREFTWKQFAERVYRLANGLKERGIGKGDRVAILSRNNNANLESYYGIAMTGGVSVPLNYRLLAREVEYIVNHSGCRAIVAEHVYADLLRSVQAQLKTVEFILEIDSFDKTDGEPIGIPYERFLKTSSPDSLEVPVEDENDMLSICYTSGTTGVPKGCVHTHRGSYLNALGEVIEAQMKPESSYLWILPMFHSQGWNFVWAVTAIGAKHVCLDAVRAEQIFDLMAKEGVTHMCGAPTACAMIADYMKQNNLKFPHTVRGFIAGAPPTAQNFHDGWQLGLDLHQVYGLTEVYGPHTICEWNEDEWGRASEDERIRLRLRQGVPYVTCPKVKVVDEQMREVPRDGKTAGEIVMRGNNVMQGYYRDEAKTAEAFAGGWFHSGDSAVVDPDGYIRIVDRIKDIVVTGGEKVPSVEVEAIIMTHPAVQDVAVVGKPDHRWGEIVKAVVKAKDGSSVTEQDIILWCRSRMAGFKTPREVEFAEIPRTATGKIQKNVLKKRELELARAR